LQLGIGDAEQLAWERLKMGLESLKNIILQNAKVFFAGHHQSKIA
jgi:hypothetical protein